MSVQCWVYEVSELEDEALFARGLSSLPWQERREKILRLRSPLGRRLALGAGLLLSHALREAGAEELRLDCGPQGKPFLTACPQLHFNLSHSGSLALCAVAEFPVGADVEKIGPCRPGVARRCFRPEELDWLARSPDPDRDFVRLWTRKESYLKLLGIGLTRMDPFFPCLPGEDPAAGFAYFEREFPGHWACLCAPAGSEAVFRPWHFE